MSAGFERACKVAGGVGILAERMTALSGEILPQAEVFTQSRLSNWKKTGIPEKYVLLVAAAVGYEETPHGINRHLYPFPHDAVPLEKRPASALA